MSVKRDRYLKGGSYMRKRLVIRLKRKWKKKNRRKGLQIVKVLIKLMLVIKVNCQLIIDYVICRINLGLINIF
jgi:hypothetical protein